MGSTILNVQIDNIYTARRFSETCCMLSGKHLEEINSSQTDFLSSMMMHLNQGMIHSSF